MREFNGRIYSKTTKAVLLVIKQFNIGSFFKIVLYKVYKTLYYSRQQRRDG